MKKEEKELDEAKKASKSRRKSKKQLTSDEEMEEYEKSIEDVLGRPRQTASLGNPSDFPTDIKEGLDDFSLNVEKMKVEEQVQSLRFRGDKKKKYEHFFQKKNLCSFFNWNCFD